MWIYKNLLQINDDFPNEILPKYLTNSDLLYLREVSLVELQVDAKNLELKRGKNTVSRINLVKTRDFLDGREKINEVHEKIKAFKRQSLFVKEKDSKSLDLRKMAELQGTFPQENTEFHAINAKTPCKTQEKHVFYEENAAIPSENLKHMMFQRSESKRQLKTQVEFLENQRKSQLQTERFFEEKQELLRKLKENKLQRLCEEFSPQDVDEKCLEKLRKRAYGLFGVKEAEDFLEENYKENASLKVENRILNQNIKGHEFLESKMEKMKRSRPDQTTQRVNYQFNPVYNKFPQLFSADNTNSSFFVINK